MGIYEEPKLFLAVSIRKQTFFRSNIISVAFRSPHVPVGRRTLIQAHSNGVHVSLFADLQDVYLSFREYATINDGQWHHIAIVWNGDSGGELTLVTEGLIASKVDGYGAGRTLPEKCVENYFSSFCCCY